MSKIRKMRNLIAIIASEVLGTLSSIAAPQDHGRILMDEEESSGVPLWFPILFIGAGILAYNIFKKDEKDNSGRGCLASIVAIILLFVIIYWINH